MLEIEPNHLLTFSNFWWQKETKRKNNLRLTFNTWGQELIKEFFRTKAELFPEQKTILVPIVRFGLEFAKGANKILKSETVGHIGSTNNNRTTAPQIYDYKFPKNVNKERDKILLIDSSIISGSTIETTIEFLKVEGFKNISILAVTSPKEVLEKLAKNYPNVTFTIGIIKENTNMMKNINTEDFTTPVTFDPNISSDRAVSKGETNELAIRGLHHKIWKNWVDLGAGDALYASKKSFHSKTFQEELTQWYSKLEDKSTVTVDSTDLVLQQEANSLPQNSEVKPDRKQEDLQSFTFN